ncbi:MAG: amidohydrolase [Firmicutes bacterium]|nr:amidohydrolase [Bacillota bacterium]
MTELIIKNATVVTMGAQRRVIDPADVIVRDGVIAAIVPALVAPGAAQGLADGALACDALTAPTAAEPRGGRRVIDAGGDVLFPGLINTHAHLFQSLLKGIGSDRRLETWWHDVIKPAAVNLELEDVRYSALAGCVEALLCGTTTIVDFMYANRRPEFCDAVMDGMSETGVRSVFARGFRNTGADRGFPPELIEDTSFVFGEVERLKSRAAGMNRMDVWIAPTAIWGLTQDALKEVRRFADSSGTRITMHTFETGTDDAVCLERYGTRAVDVMDGARLFGPDFLAVHCVKCDRYTIDILARRGAGVSHNPASNMYLASGAAPVRDMLDSGVTVCLGTDGAASNNSMNMIETMKLATLLQRIASCDSVALTAWDALEMATTGAARAIGMAEVTGSIEVGKRADMFLMKRSAPSTSPVHDPAASLVFSASPGAVRHVFVGGEPVVWEGRVTKVDAERVYRRFDRLALDLALRSGLAPVGGTTPDHAAKG